MGDYTEKDIDAAYDNGYEQGRHNGERDGIHFVRQVMLANGFSEDDARRVNVSAMATWHNSGRKVENYLDF